MAENLKGIRSLAKKSLGSKSYRGLNTIKSAHEFRSSAQYALISSLEKEYFFLETLAKNFEKNGQDIFFAENFLRLIPSKIKYLNAHFTSEGFSNVQQLLNKTKKELSCLA